VGSGQSGEALEVGRPEERAAPAPAGH